MKKLAGVVLAVVLVGAVGVSQAYGPVIEDDFDDGVLDPAWAIEFNEYCEGWTYQESGTELTVTDIATNFVTSDPSVPPTTVEIHQDIAPLTNLQVMCDLSWDSEGSVAAMQTLGVFLYDNADAVVAMCAYSDPWVMWAGAKHASIGGQTYQTGFSSLPLSGNAPIRISRAGGVASVFWNESLLLSGSSTTPVEKVGLRFDYFAFDGSTGTSFFGEEAVDLISVVPVPPGDANLDFCVDGLDYVSWSNNYLTGDTWEKGDFNGDLTADGLDYVIWSNHYLQGCPAAPGQVPEPASLLLLALGGLALIRRKRQA